MVEMKKQISSPISMSQFFEKGVGKETLLKRFGFQTDFSGCYVLIENNFPIYVGISRTVISRLLQHVKGRTHYDASLAYRIANNSVNHNLSRNEAMQTEEMQVKFEKAKTKISKMNVAFIDIKNNLEIYLFQSFCSMELDTSKWNTFATH